VRDVFGMKVDHEGKIKQIRETLLPILDKANPKEPKPAEAAAAE
jgi:hypothetical protein